MVMMKIDRPDFKCMPRPILTPPSNPVDDATFALLDGDGNGKIGADEWKRAGWTEERKADFDSNKDGEISEAEFGQGRRFEREFNAKDRDGDGKLNRPEFLGLMFRKLQADPMMRKLPGIKELLGAGEKIADKLDASIVSKLPGFSFKDRFATFDKDGDGAVSKSEYIAGRRTETSRPVIQPWPDDSFPIPMHPHKPEWPIYKRESVLADVAEAAKPVAPTEAPTEN